MKWDMLLVNADFIDPGGDSPGYLAIGDGKILASGPSHESESVKKQAQKVIDLSGLAVLPGFMDVHVHLLMTGIDLALPGLFFCRSIPEIQDILLHSGPRIGDWIIGLGFDETLFHNPILPTMDDLDKVSKKYPICIVRRDHHICILNSKALEILGIPPETEEEKRGIMRGDSIDNIYAIIYSSLSVEEKIQALQRACRAALSFGITCVHALEGGRNFGDEDIVLALENADSLPIDVIIYPQTLKVNWVKYELELPRIGGCILVDGTIGSRTAALYEDYADDPGNSGILYFEDHELEKFVEEAHVEGLQVALHAIGDKAVGQVTGIYERIIKKHYREDCRHRIEHGILSRPQDIEKMSSLGIHLSVQPVFHHLWGGENGLYETRLGKERYKKIHPYRTYIDHGITIAGSSDSDVCPMDVMLAINSAVNRDNDEEVITPLDALNLYTVNAAKFSFQEKERGRLLPGMKADLVILSENPLITEHINEIEVIATVVGGELKFGRLEW
ncbi:MAG: amidohydrolase [Candidatus Eremiobacteraeota bacterium]|nr:amidohydrolase [Candidatus Eremiobacteraeota bacterium]